MPEPEVAPPVAHEAATADIGAPCPEIVVAGEDRPGGAVPEASRRTSWVHPAAGGKRLAPAVPGMIAVHHRPSHGRDDAGHRAW
ncbi:hypothetical protein GCM10022243_54180 [Saccharothrix violaceirubra]|uniref:Uncharacterized protein n=1 Tax=Saccharothrix violaceirubra TaxID=413306 RepID=A0A7W7T7X7_9PSEU|nr:hypothetical protein [Saccharothrix violaceirubra]MBB4966930.1 hypothetical protein [Saccharothrix violaceirubra]